MSWSEFAAGTLWAQLGHFGGESGGLNFAETRVVSVPGEGLEPSRGKPSQDFKSCAFFRDPYLPKVSVLPLTQCSPKLLNLNGLEGKINWLIYESEG